jgi:MFS family permease
MSVDNISDTARAIQLAVAPVFLLTGIAALLGVMANRLSRIIDRWRFFQQTWSQLDSRTRGSSQAELQNLERRRRLASISLYACTLAALLICVVIATLFIEVLFSLHIRGLVSALFICAMAALISGLSTFLREVYLATRTMRISLRGHEID